MNKLHVKKGDTVVILSGKDNGKKGKVLAVSPSEQKIIVEGCNMVTKHVKPRKMGENGGIIKAEGAFYASKAMRRYFTIRSARRRQPCSRHSRKSPSSA